MHARFYGSLFAILVVIAGPLHAGQERKPSPLIGQWGGQVFTENLGDMPITLTLQADDKGVVGGEVGTLHGKWKVVSVAAKGSAWTVRFQSDDGMNGEMVGQAKGNAFSGKWDFKPRAEGTFQLERIDK
jgi:hypothetical protein